MAKSNFIVRGGADFSGISNSFKKLQKDMKGYQSTLSKTVKGIGVILGGLATGKLIKDSTAVAMGVESAIDNIGRNMGESSKAFHHWVNTQSKALGMAKSDAYKYGSTFSNLLSSFTSSTQETAEQTQELMKAAAIISSKTGRTYDDTANRIRSGMLGSTEAIEDLGVYTNISMIESTKAFKKFANGKSWSQLSFQTQQQIRLAAILEQTYARYGDTLADTTQTRQAKFIASLKDAQLSLGQAFLPIYNIVLPALTSLAQSLAYVMNIIAQFSQALFGKNQTQEQTKSISNEAGAVTDLGDAYKDAGKKAKGALMGFDEINQLADNSSAGVTAGGITSDLATNIGTMPVNFETNAPEISARVQEMADKVKRAMTDIKNTMSENKDLIISATAGIVSGFAAFKVISNWTAIVAGFKAAFAGLGGVISGLSAPIIAVSALIGMLVANIVDLWQTDEDFRNSVIKTWTQLKNFVVKIATEMWQTVEEVWDKYGKTLKKNLDDFLGGIKKAIKTVWEGFLKPIITKALETLTWLWDKHLKGLIRQIGEFVMKCVNGALEIWNKFISPIVGWMMKIFAPIIAEAIKTAIDMFGSLLAGVIDVAKGLFKALGGIIDFIAGVFTGDWKKAWGGVKDVFKGVFDSLTGIVKVPLNIMIDMINTVLKGLNKINIEIPDWVPKFGGKSWGINIKPIQPLAKGGITNGPMVAMVGDNPGGREVVSPLDDLVNIIASAVGSAVMAAKQFDTGSDNRDREVVLNIDGTKLGRVILPKLNQESQRLGYKSILQT